MVDLLYGSVALVTGGVQGIGLAFVQVMAENGAYVSLLDTNREVGIKAIDQLEKKYNALGKLLFIECDVTKKDEFEAAFQKTFDKFGKINIVINNAGIMTKYLDEWEHAIDVNYKGVVRGTILGLKFIENKVDNNSAVINVSSITGLSNTVLPIYQSTKRAVIEFTRSIGCSYNSKANNNNVRIMAICPGPTFDGFENDKEKKKMFEEKLRTFFTNGEENPDPNRKILVQSTKYVKSAFIYIMKHGKMGDIWISENEEPPRLSNVSI